MGNIFFVFGWIRFFFKKVGLKGYSQLRLYGCLSVVILGVPIEALELNRVILSTNNDPKYAQFWAIVAPIWKAMGFQPTLALIANEMGDIDTSLGDVILFPVLPEMPESLQAQAIRLLLPALYSDEGCLLADIDMIPISKDYFFNGAMYCPDEGFVVYRDRAYIEYEKCRWPMCYVAAKGEVFQSIFGVYSIEDVAHLLRYWHSLGYGWSTDEYLMYKYVTSWEANGGRVVRLGHDVEGRLDRGNWQLNYQGIDLNGYIDCHCPRPYDEYKESIDQVLDAIRQRYGIMD